jgi:hypothetical protein
MLPESPLGGSTTSGVITISIYSNIFIIPTINSWQTQYLMQYIIFP